MTSEDTGDVSELLQAWRAGDSEALHALLPRIHDSLHGIAAREMAREGRDHTLQATALMNEAYLRLLKSDVTWADRSHFLAIAARSMRRVLVDHARAKRREKRGGGAVALTLHETRVAGPERDPSILDIERVLTRLGNIDERKARVIEMSFFGGMTHPEMAEALGVSESTIDKELRFAKAWLYKELAGGPEA